MPGLELQNLLNAIGTAVKDAQLAVEAHAVKRFSEHFEQEKSESGSLMRPRTILMALPRTDGGYNTVPVPQVLLAHHNALSLEQVTIRMRISTYVDPKSGRVEVDLGSTAGGDDNGEERRTTPLGEMELVFKREDTPEGMARILREAAKVI